MTSEAAAVPSRTDGHPRAAGNGHGHAGSRPVAAAAPVVPATVAAQPAPAARRTEAPSGAVSGTGRLVRNLAMLLSSQVGIWLVTFVSNVFVPRGLGPARMGELTVATSVGTVLDTIFSLGYGPLMVKVIARDRSRASGLVGTALLTRLLLLLPATGTVLVLTTVIHASQELTVLIWLATAGTFVGFFGGPFNASFQALERMEYVAFANVLSRGAVAFASVVLVLVHYGPGHILAMTLFATALVTVLFWWWSRPLFGVDWRWSGERARFLLVGSLPYWTTALVLSFYMWIDSLMLSAMAPINVVGWYSVPTRLFAALLFFPVILSTAYLPRLSRAYGAGPEALAREARRVIELTLSASFPVMAGLALVSWQLTWVLYGPEYLPSVPVMIVLALALPATYLNIMANQVLIAANGQTYWTFVMIGAAIANPLLNLFSIHYAQSQWGNGALGAAAALLATEVGMAVAGVVLMIPLLRWSVVARVARAAAATLVMSVVVWLVAHRYGLTPMVASGALTFPLAALLFGVLTREELRELRRYAVRSVRRS